MRLGKCVFGADHFLFSLGDNIMPALYRVSSRGMCVSPAQDKPVPPTLAPGQVSSIGSLCVVCEYLGYVQCEAHATSSCARTWQ